MGFPGGIEGGHDFEGVVAEFTGGTDGAVIAHGFPEVDGSDAAVAEVGEVAGVDLPVHLGVIGGPATAADFIFPIEVIGVGGGEGALGAVNFDEGQVGAAGAVEAEDRVDEDSVLKFDGAVVMGIDVDGNEAAVGGLAFLQGARGVGHDGLGGAEKVNQGSDVVGAHVEEGAAAGLVVKGRVGVPEVVATADEEDLAGAGFTDGTAIQERPGGLLAGAEEGIGGATHAQALLSGEGEDIFPILQGVGKGFLAVGVFARFQDPGVYFGVGGGNGEVDHHLNFRVGQQVLDRAKGNVEFLGTLPGSFLSDVGASGHLYSVIGSNSFEVGFADHTTTNDSDFQGIHGKRYWLL